MNKIKKLTIYIANIPLYWIAKLILKDKNIWIFGAWFGEKYADNSKYLFEHINKYNPDIRAIWMTTNIDTLKLVKSKGYEVYLTYSVKGYYLSAKSNFSFVSTGFNDVNLYIPSRNIINLWHGNPLKKIMHDDKINLKYKNNLRRKFVKLLFPFSKDTNQYDYIVASSDLEARNIASAFKVNVNKILITGLPRNEVFLNSRKSNNDMFKVIYMPTHRNKGEFDISNLFLKNLELINSKLILLNTELHIKLHFYHLNDIDNIDFSNVKFILDKDIEQDIYSIINQYDILITDYSSIFFDFLLSGKPIIFAPFDYKEYLTKDRELYYDYEKVTPGPKCKNWEEVLKEIEKYKIDPTIDENERINIVNKFHKYQNYKFCENIYYKIMNIK